MNLKRMALSGLSGLSLVSFFDALASTPVMADTHRIAYSVEQKLDIEAVGGDNWCSPNVVLQMDLDSTSPLMQNKAAWPALMHKVGQVVVKMCPQAETTQITVQKTENGQFSVLGVYMGEALMQWQFTKVTVPTAAAAPAATPVPVPAATPAPAPVPTAAPETFVLPAYTDYKAVFLAYVANNPSLKTDPNVVQWWTAQTFPDAYRQVQSQEFKLQPLLQEGQQNLAQALQQSNGTIVLVLQINLDSYDFSKDWYPLSLASGINISGPYNMGVVAPEGPFQIQFDAQDLPGIPISKAAAAAYEAQHTDQFGNRDSSALIALKLKLNQGAFANSQTSASATIESAALYVPAGRNENIDPQKEQPLVVITESEIDAFRAQTKAQAAAAAHAAQIAQRSADIQTVSGYSPDQKLYSWLNTDPLSGVGLNDIYDARANSLFNQQAVNVTMLVKTDGSGRTVKTSWPGNLSLVAQGTLPSFSGSSWYLVSGSLLASAKTGDLSSTLTVGNAYKCKQDQCAEALNPTALIDHRDSSLNH